VFNVIIDTREQQGWEFTSDKVESTISRKLDTGDYSIEGLEHVLCIERKKSVAEIAGNVIDDRFFRELERMAEFPHSFLICEFDFEDIVMYPQGSNIPKKMWKKVKVRGPLILKKLSEIQVNYDVHIVFAGNADNAVYAATNIMKRIHEKYEIN
jgi:ERCC4-type nuclease